MLSGERNSVKFEETHAEKSELQYFSKILRKKHKYDYNIAKHTQEKEIVLNFVV